MRKIALISEHASPLAHIGGVDSGGQNVYVAQVARNLALKGYKVDVFTRRDGSLLPAVNHWMPNVRVINVPIGPARFVPKELLLPLMPAFSEWLMNFFRRQRQSYELIHANFFMSGHAALPVAKALGLPLVMTFHALGKVRRQHLREADTFPEQRLAIEAQLVQQADRIIAECPQDRDDLLQLYSANPDKVSVVPCGFDPEELAPVPRLDARRQLGWNAHEFTILQLGRLVPRKGIDNVIRGLAVLQQAHGIPARLYVVGGNAVTPNEIATPEIGRLRKLAETLGVADRVTFLGRRLRDELKFYYSAADVFVTTPAYEPFGITPLEAMACGTPVIASAVGGLRSTVLDRITGLLVPPADPAALGEALANLAANDSLSAMYGEFGRYRVNRHYTWRQVVQSLECVYEAAAGADPRVDASTEAMHATGTKAALSPLLRRSALIAAGVGI